MQVIEKCLVPCTRSVLTGARNTILKNIRRARITSDYPRAHAPAGQSEDEHNTHNNLTRSSHAALLVHLYLPSPPVPSSDPVTVTTSKARVEVHENTNAVLSCEFRTEKETNPRVEWKKRGKDVSYVYFDGDFTGSFKGRASIDGATMTLRGVTQKDSGVYHCEVTARQDKIKLGEVTVTLNVLVAPHAPLCEVPETVMKGFSAELRCKDKLSVPAATYSWYKDNKPLHTANLPEINYTLDPKTGTLKFKAVSKSDEGQYRCEASNGVGAPKSCAGRHMKITECKISSVW
ncbi:hypothetical protein cypCar_00036937 [Cyprinus carpio]|nr:hypothetical protein cypCar_00036937 [Cyprinus carpio]